MLPFEIFPSLRASGAGWGEEGDDVVEGNIGLLVAELRMPACLVPQFSGVTSEESFLHEWKVFSNPCLY